MYLETTKNPTSFVYPKARVVHC